MNSYKAARMMTDLGQREAAEKLGVSIHTLRGWEQGKAKPSAEALLRMAKLYECPTTTLENTRTTQKQVDTTSSISSLSRREYQLLKAWRSVTVEQQSLVVALLETMNTGKVKVKRPELAVVASPSKNMKGVFRPHRVTDTQLVLKR